MKLLLSLTCLFLTGVGASLAAQDVQLPKSDRLGVEYVYKEVDNRKLKLYVLTPPKGKATDHRPAIVWFHGGSWVKGGPNAFNVQSQYLAGRGMVCIQVEYRLLPREAREAPIICVEDARSAMRWVRSHAAELGIDPDRIAAGGGSAGGHLAAACALIEGFDDPQDKADVSPKPAALVLFCPVIDTGSKTTWGRNTFKEHADELSPAGHVNPKAPPTLLMIGTADRLIPVKTIEAFAEKMKAAGVRCEIRLYQGQPHGFFNPKKGTSNPFTYETLLEVDKFLNSLGWLPGPPTLKETDIDQATTAPTDPEN
ncbi:alpha/beta hydrolase [soil metagenome]